MLSNFLSWIAPYIYGNKLWILYRVIILSYRKNMIQNQQQRQVRTKVMILEVDLMRNVRERKNVNKRRKRKQKKPKKRKNLVSQKKNEPKRRN